MFETLKKTLAILTPPEKRKALILLLLMIFVAVFEMISVVSIMPFLSVIAKPEIIETNKYLKFTYNYLKFENQKDFLYFLGGTVFLLLVLGNIIKSLYIWAEVRFINMRGHDISKRLLKKYLEKTYIFFVNRNSGDLARNVLDEVNKIMVCSLKPFMSIASQAITSLFVVSIIIASDPFLAATMAFIIGFIYFVIYRALKKKLLRLGEGYFNSNKERYITINEIFGGIKDLKLLGLEKTFLKIYEKPSRKRADYYCFHQLAALIPQYILEILAMGSVLIATFYLMSIKNDIGYFLPILGLYAYAGKKIVPAMQAIFGAITLIKFNGTVVDNIFKELNLEESDKKNIKIDDIFGEVKNIELKNLKFQYPSNKKLIIDDLNLSIKAKTTVGFAGSTGSGKTTLVDIILGLLRPTSGDLIVNGQKITGESIRSWQSKLGYIPQFIFLTDDTVAKNIAFGIPDDEINMDIVKDVAEKAQIKDFIEQLPDKYNTIVGERGVKFSGGQRQRIGIARALYRDPEVLILDEATSALDNITERSVMAAIRKLSGLKTLILIAHRLTTLKNADIIHFIENGKIISSGNYDEMLANTQFADLVRAAQEKDEF
ncbi:MAG: ABC transporter ATP-binding protein [Alphaproteobacteria bacterium]